MTVRGADLPEVRRHTPGRGSFRAERERVAGLRPDTLRLADFRRRRLGERARQRERLRLRLRALLALGGRLLVEDVLLGLPGEQPLELVLVDRLALDQDRRQPMQLVHVLLEDAVRG